jgi:hypothetical protein
MKTSWRPLIIYGFVSLLVLAPLLGRGFILTLDMVFTPWLPMPTEVTSSYLFHALVHVLNLVISSDIIQKLLLLSILLVSMLGMHRLIRALFARQDIEWGLYLASMLYAINPFTYDRFMAGQYAVLLGYALLPWFVRQCIMWRQRPNWRETLRLSGVVIAISIVSIHTLGAVAILAIAGLASTTMRRQHWRFIAAALGMFVLCSSYWLVPLALGQGKTADTIAHMGGADAAAFQTVGPNTIGRVGNVLRLQGFWVESKRLYYLPQEKAVLWGLMSIVILALAVYGGIRLLKQGRHALVYWLGGSALVAICIASYSGAGSTLLAHVGLREPHKLVMLLALFYSVFFAYGTNELLARLRKKGELRYAAAAIILIILPFLHMRVMFWGFNGQLAPKHYPTDWFAVRNQLQRDGQQGHIVFLPWHQYMSFDFAGRIIASPAPAFFGPNVIVSQDPELGGASGGINDQQQNTITAILDDQTTLGPKLAAQDVAYIVVAKDLDYQDYDYLIDQPELTIAYESSTIRLYKNQAWRQL